MLAFSIPFYLKELADVISTVLLPAFSKIQDFPERLAEAFSLSNKYLATLFIPAGTATYIFAQPIIHYLYTDKWAPAAPLLQLFAIGFTLDTSLGFTTGWLALARGKVKYTMYSYLIALLCLSTGGLFLIHRYGPVGGAYYTILQTLVIVLFVQIPFIYKEIGTLNYLWGIWRPLVAGAGAGLFTYIIILPMVKSVTLFLLALVSFGVVYLALLFVVDRKMCMEISQFPRMLLARIA